MRQGLATLEPVPQNALVRRFVDNFKRDAEIFQVRDGDSAKRTSA
jgi:hypothetical protein